MDRILEKTYTTTDGRCLKRLGKNSKPLYPDELSNVYSSIQNPDFSGRIISESTIDDVILVGGDSGTGKTVLYEFLFG